jgi:hypothetical protein
VFVVRLRALIVGVALATVVLLCGVLNPAGAVAADPRVSVTAYLDGVAIPLEDVSKFYCDDFAYPVITCSRTPLVTSVRSTLFVLLASVEYVTIYELTSYSGAWMNVSQDYTALALVGWNDRISSFRVRNSETGRFYVDWFFGGSTWSFCCNSQLPTLGAYDNTFSSIQRT